MPTINVFQSRLERYQSQLSTTQAALLSYPSDITYFTGFQFLVPEEREALLLITARQAYLLHTSFAELPPHAIAQLLVGCASSKLLQHIEVIQKETAINQVLIDSSSLFVEEYQALQRVVGLTLAHLDKKSLWQLRVVKDNQEIEYITQACKIAAESFAKIFPLLKAGVTEKEIQTQLEDELRRRGSQRPAFPTIVCFGPDSALPHHQPTTTKLTNNMPVLLDFGATVNGYRSDMSRSFWFGDQPTSEYQKIETIVKTAYQRALTTLSQPAPLTAKDLDLSAREYIKSAGYAPQFIHTTGHGVGLDIHEPPSLHWQNLSELKPGMTLTVEPGIYLPGKFGYRYENTVLLTAKGYQELSVV